MNILDFGPVWALNCEFATFDGYDDARISEGLLVCTPPPSPSLSGVPKDNLLTWDDCFRFSKSVRQLLPFFRGSIQLRYDIVAYCTIRAEQPADVIGCWLKL